LRVLPAEPPAFLYHDLTPRVITTPRHAAYIKIAEGCDHPCTFCIIPQLRGKFRSRRFESVVREAENLAASGARELTLIGQDTTSYGEDLGLRDGLAQLLEKLAGVDDLLWVRFLYAYPNRVTQKLLDVAKRIAKDELGNETWLRKVAGLLGRSYEEMRVNTLEFLDTDVFSVSPDHCTTFLDPLIDSWQIDLKTFAIQITLNPRLVSTQVMKLRYVETEEGQEVQEEPGFRDFLGTSAMSGDASEDELDFLKHLRFKRRRPSSLYYYRELQSLRDPLHFRESSVAPMHKRRDAEGIEKQIQVDSRKRAIQRWTRNKTGSRKGSNGRPSLTRPRRPDIN